MPIIYLPKWVELLVTLYNMPDNERYCQRLYRKLKMNSSHVRTMIHHLEKHSLIKRVPDRKIRYITLTEKGNMLAELMLRIKTVLNQENHDN